MNEYLRTLLRLIESKEIPDSANLTITANDGEPAIVQVRDGMKISVFIEREDQSALDLVHSRTI